MESNCSPIESFLLTKMADILWFVSSPDLQEDVESLPWVQSHWDGYIGAGEVHGFLSPAPLLPTLQPCFHRHPRQPLSPRPETGSFIDLKDFDDLELMFLEYSSQQVSQGGVGQGGGGHRVAALESCARHPLLCLETLGCCLGHPSVSLLESEITTTYQTTLWALNIVCVCFIFLGFIVNSTLDQAGKIWFGHRLHQKMKEMAGTNHLRGEGGSGLRFVFETSNLRAHKTRPGDLVMPDPQGLSSR